MATKTINLSTPGCYFSNSNIASYGGNAITTSAISGGGTALLGWFFDWEEIFGTRYITINSITLKYKAVSNRSLSTYKQATVRTGYMTSPSSSGNVQVYEYVQSTAREGKTPTSYTDYFDGSVWNDNLFTFTDTNKTHYATGLYMVTHNPGSFNITIYYTEVSVVVDYTIRTIPINLTVSPENGGTVVGGGDYPIGNSVTIEATANSGYVFSHWITPQEQIAEVNPATFKAESRFEGTWVAVFVLDKINNILADTIQSSGVLIDITEAAEIYADTTKVYG